MTTDENSAPEVTSFSKKEATGGIYFMYQAEVSDPDGPSLSVLFSKIPAWLTTDADSVYGTPPDGLADTSFLVIASDGLKSDSLTVTIDIIPSIVIYGDTRTGHMAHEQIVAQIRQVKPAVVFHVGDLVNDGINQADWDIFNNIVSEMISESEFFPALGNHEKQSQLYFDNFILPNNEMWYSVNRNLVHFVVLNSNVDLSVGSEQYQWLQKDLSQIDTSIKFIIAITHHSPYSTGAHPVDEKNLRSSVVPLFEQSGVDIVFSGHDHSFEVSLCGDIYYVVTGGGGAPLYDQTRQHECSQLYLKSYEFCKLSIVDNRAIVKTYDNNGILLNQFEIVETTK